MWQARNTPKGAKSVDHAFYVQEPASFIGSYGGWMNGVIDLLMDKLDLAGGKRPYGIKFGGGDGKVTPVILTMFEAR